jgi:chromosome segregation ATPase
VPPGREGEPDALAAAYEQRSAQLYEARGALAETVSALRTELDVRRDEAAQLREQRDNAVREYHELREHAVGLTDEVHRLRGHAAALEAQLQEAREAVGELRNMKVVRWTVWPRRIVYRLRRRRR